MILPEKSVLSEVLDLIRLMVGEGKTDLQISAAMKFPLPEIYRIRRTILKISLYGTKRKCAKCGHNKSVVCFNNKSEHPDWCVICRKKYGGERGFGRPSGKKPNQICKEEYKKAIICLCLRCEKTFKSDIFIGHGGQLDHYRCCPKCREIIDRVEAVSI